jgi:hypothetical protein
MQLIQSVRDGQWLTRARLLAYCRILAVAYLVTIVVWVALADGWKDRAGNPIGTDFVNVYAAGLMVRDGHAPEVYDWAAHKQVENQVTGYEAAYYGWHYPPMFLGVAALVALLPYGWALAVYMFGGMAAYIVALSRITPKNDASLWAIAAFPGLFVNLGNGQNGFITAALLGGGLYLLRAQPWLGGILLGGLSYKPQFFVIIPCLLLCGRAWRALIACVTTAAFLMGLSVLAFGFNTWKAFIASTVLTQKIILEQGAAGWGKIQSLFATARGLGVGLQTAYALQAVVAGAAILTTAWIWRRKDASAATQMAALCCCLLLITPYLFDYDLMVLAVPVGFLATQALRDGFIPYEKTFLAVLWVWPFIARAIGMHSVTLTTPLLIGLLALCFYRTRNASNLLPLPKH